MICGPGSEMDWSEEDQEVAVSTADARAERARRSAQPSNKEGLVGPTLETPLKETGLPPSPPSPPIDGRTLSDPEAWTRWLRSMYRVAQLLYTAEALEEFRKGKGKSGGARGEGASDKRAVALEARERLGLRLWEQEGCCLAHRLASRLAMPCPRHRQAGREAGPHQYLSKPFHCGCCVGTCELCDPSLSAAS